MLHAQLRAATAALAAGEPAEAVLAQARANLTQAGFIVDYFALVDGPSLEPLDAMQPNARLITTAMLGAVRLLDNMAA